MTSAIRAPFAEHEGPGGAVLVAFFGADVLHIAYRKAEDQL